MWLRRSIEVIGETGLTLFEIARDILHGKINWRETLNHIEKEGIGSLPIVSLSASFIGMAVAIQFGQEIVSRFGAKNLVGGFVSLAMIRELAPVFVAVVMAGNIGAAMTAEIGTMKVTDQIDALKVFHINPIHYLVIPRIIALGIVGPVLTIYGAFLSMLTGQLCTELLIHLPGELFWDSARLTLTMRDIINMLIKSMVFALAISVIASINGLATEGGSEAVGTRTTQTVVWCLLAIFALNLCLTSLFFY